MGYSFFHVLYALVEPHLIFLTSFFLLFLASWIFLLIFVATILFFNVFTNWNKEQEKHHVLSYLELSIHYMITTGLFTFFMLPEEPTLFVLAVGFLTPLMLSVRVCHRVGTDYDFLFKGIIMGGLIFKLYDFFPTIVGKGLIYEFLVLYFRKMFTVYLILPWMIVTFFVAFLDFKLINGDHVSSKLTNVLSGSWMRGKD